MMEIKTKADPRDVIGITEDLSHDALVLITITECRHGRSHAALAWINQDEAVRIVNHLCNLYGI